MTDTQYEGLRALVRDCFQQLEHDLDKRFVAIEQRLDRLETRVEAIASHLGVDAEIVNLDTVKRHTG